MPHKILFLCEDNAAASLMAEALVNGSGTRDLWAFSVGFAPAAEADPDALAVIAQAGLRVAGLHPKPVSLVLDGQEGHFDLAINLCNYDHPDFPRLPVCRPVEHWPLSAATSSLVQGERRQEQVRELFAEIRQLVDAILLRPAQPLALGTALCGNRQPALMTAGLRW